MNAFIVLTRCVYVLLCTQIFGGRWRALGNALFSTAPTQVGHLLLALFVYLAPDLFYLEVLLGAAGAASFVLGFLMPESPQWMLARGGGGREEEALVTIGRIAKTNNKVCDREALGRALRDLRDQRAAANRNPGPGQHPHPAPTLRDYACRGSAATCWSPCGSGSPSRRASSGWPTTPRPSGLARSWSSPSRPSSPSRSSSSPRWRRTGSGGAPSWWPPSGRPAWPRRRPPPCLTGGE